MYVYLEGATRKVLRAMLRIRMRRGRRGCGRRAGGEEVLTAQSEVCRGVGVGCVRARAWTLDAGGKRWALFAWAIDIEGAPLNID